MVRILSEMPNKIDFSTSFYISIKNPSKGSGNRNKCMDLHEFLTVDNFCRLVNKMHLIL